MVPIALSSAPRHMKGGLTPSLGVLKTVRETVTIPVHPIIRPRGGDFCYTESEFAAMLDDVVTVRELGFPRRGHRRVRCGWSGRYRAHAKNHGGGRFAGGHVPSGFLICVRIRIRLIARWPIPAWPRIPDIGSAGQRGKKVFH
ncbi:Copper homeostasis protein CutC [Raoultella planticola]|uniref:Copper homeostasis protein cutC homolog n=1 Tax=Raoultella planticola TaxID=575 RepID=A0A485ACD3_RAOPL|nr:Copper homeostasis protein CutC [Raoultella planticola]